ncbi:GGDEF domain-containing protein [Magnetospirillum fulvum]|uniref:Diguanylate cyclase (GGDEF) domain-containing protein n=1 Tax=Magnetospirillum fulvum TaxID=1082 RepID=A0A1H6IBT7_MAGFU|nr:diguanylate cyclase [Magnetospirillum fulvum]SEH43655.1 diguanylate cyclase (GGDEF) domain-containing protein [Magnetospirillum fulvum]
MALTAAPVKSVIALLTPIGLSEDLRRRRARLILGRVRLVATVFAVLTLLWIPLDLAIFKTTMALYLAALRVLASVAFVMLALSFRRTDSSHAATLSLVWLLAIPTLFFLISHPLLAQFPLLSPEQQVVAAGYAFLPFVMVAGLAMFPISALEGALLGLAPLLAYLLTGLMSSQLLPFASHLGAQWLLLLLTVVATLAGMSQLSFLARLVDEGAFDPVTATYSRRIGEILLAQSFITAQRVEAPLAVALVRIEDLAALAEQYGPDEGDGAVGTVALALRQVLRRGDLLIRWDDSVFLAMMPNSGGPGASGAMERMCAAGLGPRPDGRPLMVTVGTAERRADQADSWEDLVARANGRRAGDGQAVPAAC